MIEGLVLDTLLDSTLTGIYITDHNGNYIYANASFLKMSGGDTTDIPRMNVFNMVKDGFVTQSAALTAFERKKRVTMMNRVNNQKGYFYNQLITATPLFDGNGEIEFMVVEMMNLNTLGTQLENFYIDEQNLTEKRKVFKKRPSEDIVAVSPAMRNLLSLADEIAPLDTTVLITGETGTGKEVLAHYIHEHSNRSDRKMVALNCATLPPALFESELFGYEKGAYTGALSTGKKGLIQQANGGTLFLDEVNSMPLSIQGKLLRVLEDGQVRRIGALNDETVNFRLISASNHNLQDCVADKTFREDLYYRLAVVPLEIPPLRERSGDIIPLAFRFLNRYTEQYKRTKLLTESALSELQEYHWPGNVRELKNVIERIVVTTSISTVEINRVPISMLVANSERRTIPQLSALTPIDYKTFYAFSPENTSLKDYLDYCEILAIKSVLKDCSSTREAAKVLKIDQSSIVRKRQKYNKD